MSLKDLLQLDASVKNIKVKIISKEQNTFIVGDASSLGSFISPANQVNKFVAHKCYMFLKPIRRDEYSFVPNEKYKPVEVKDFSLSYPKSEIKKIAGIIKSSFVESNKETAETKTIATFKDLDSLGAQSEVRSITVKIITISKDISGNYGKYNIAKIKDFTGERMDINLYNNKVKKQLHIADIVEFRGTKISEYTKENERIRRLSTTSRTIISTCENRIVNLFKNVPLGDVKKEAKVIAIHDIYQYYSCEKCWKKTREEETICPCGNSVNIHVIDFHCQFYLELVKDSEIKVIHTFRRQTELFILENNKNEIQQELENKFLQKTFSFEWNIILGDEENLRMVKIDNIVNS